MISKEMNWNEFVLRTDEEGFRDASFLAVKDSLFAISRLNEGSNENDCYYVAEFLVGRSPVRLPNYLVYDKETGKLNRVEIDLDRSYEIHQFHIGIFNDYDGGLAFTPLYQTGDYLIMVNADEAQGWEKDFPKTLYKLERSINHKSYPCRSDIYHSISDKKR